MGHLRPGASHSGAGGLHYGSVSELASASRTFDTAPYSPLWFSSDAELPPSRSSPPSWNLHAGGLPWPDVNGQRDLKKHPSPLPQDPFLLLTTDGGKTWRAH